MKDEMREGTTTSTSGHPTVADYLSPHAHGSGPLLVATAGGSSPAVFTAARLLSTRLDTVPIVVAVNEPLPFYLPGGAPEMVVPPEIYESQRERLRGEVVRTLRSTEGADPAWPVEVVDGQPARTIVGVAHEWNARLIVMGIGRHSPMDRVFGGEMALQVIRLADCPVVAVAANFTEFPRHAMVALDFSAASVRAAVEALAMLAEGGTLSLVHVRSPAARFDEMGAETMGTIYAEGIDRLFERLVKRLETALAGRRSVTIERVTLAGDPADELLAYAEANGADLIAAGSSGAGFFERLVVGSVATRLIRRSTVSVLAVPRPSAAMVETIERELAGEATGVGTIEAPEESAWPALLETFTARNAGRPTRLEIDDPSIGAQLLETGYTLAGASYDRKDGRLELMFRAPGDGAGHLTHTVGGVTSVAVLTGPDRRDLALQARHGGGQTVLTFPDIDTGAA